VIANKEGTNKTDRLYVHT